MSTSSRTTTTVRQRVALSAEEIRRTRQRAHGRKMLQSFGKHLLLWPLSALFILPWLWMITTSVKTMENIYRFPPQWIPHPMVWDAYPKAIIQARMLTYVRNTLIIAVPTVLGALVSNTMAAYGFSRIQWPGRDQVFMLVLATMMLPYQVRMIPMFLIFYRLRWVNTYLPLIVPHFLGSAWFTFMLRQFFMTIPQDLFDAARIDGCSEARIVLQVLVPLAKPALAVVALFRFLGAWNDFVGPLIYLNDQRLFPISVGLMNLRQIYGGEDWAMLMAGATITVTPIVILFFFTQRTFIEGITLTGIKG